MGLIAFIAAIPLAAEYAPKQGQTTNHEEAAEHQLFNEGGVRSPAQSPDSPQHQEQSDDRIGPGTMPDWAIVAFTLMLTVLGGLQYRLDRRTARETRDALDIARRNSEAALISAKMAERMLNGVERPLLYVEYPTDHPDDAVWVAPKTKRLTLEVVNYGRTPAIIEEHSIDCKVSRRTPRFDPSAEFTDLTASGGVISPGKSITWKVTFDPEVIKSVSIGNQFYIFGWVSYHDLIGNRYEHGFCLQWYDHFYMRALGKEDNYNKTYPAE